MCSVYFCVLFQYFQSIVTTDEMFQCLKCNHISIKFCFFPFLLLSFTLTIFRKVTKKSYINTENNCETSQTFIFSNTYIYFNKEFMSMRRCWCLFRDCVVFFFFGHCAPCWRTRADVMLVDRF